MTASTEETSPPAPAAAAAPAATAAKSGYAELGYAFAAIGAILFSTKAVAIKLAYGEPVDAATLLALRMALSVPIYVVIGSPGDRATCAAAAGRCLPLKTVLQAALVGVLGYWFASYADFIGLEFISAQFERLILFTYPLFVVIFGALFFRQPMRLKAVGAILVSYAGLALIFVEKLESGGSNAVRRRRIGAGLGAGLRLLSAARQAGDRRHGPAAVHLRCHERRRRRRLRHLPRRPSARRPDGEPARLRLSVFLAIGATVLPSFFLNAALHRISAQANAAIGTVSPVVTIVLATVFLGETLSPAGILRRRAGARRRRLVHPRRSRPAGAVSSVRGAGILRQKTGLPGPDRAAGYCPGGSPLRPVPLGEFI